MFFTKPPVVILGLLLLTLGFSLYKLGDYPAMMHRDELAIGYNAYSLLLTGKDEHGQSYPLWFQSFGDYKLPGLIYSTLLSYQWFGFSPGSTRLPTALFASVTPLLVLIIVWQLTRRFWWAAGSILLVILSPWHLWGSRTAYEPIVGQMWLWLAITLLFKGGTYPKIWMVAALVLGVSGFFYNVPFLLAVPVWVAFFWCFRHSIAKPYWKWAKYATVILGLCVIGYFLFSRPITMAKSQTTIFAFVTQDEQINRYVHHLHTQGVPLLLARLVHNKAIVLVQEITSNYLKVWDPQYVWFDGDTNPWRDMGTVGVGLLPWLWLPFMGLGLGYWLYYFKHQEMARWVVVMLVLVPIPSALTIDSPVTNRLQDFLLLLTICCAVGLGIWWQYLKNLPKRIGYTLKTLTIELLGYSVLQTLLAFFVLYPSQMDWDWYQELDKIVAFTTQVQSDYSRIVVDTKSIELGYIYWAFYGPFQPSAFQQQALWIEEGYDRVLAFDRYEFSSYDNIKQAAWVNEHLPTKKDKVLFIEQVKEPKVYNNLIRSYSTSQHPQRWILREFTRDMLIHAP